MAFIGNQPTAVPLTSSQLVDGIITTSKLAADAVTSAKILDSTIVNADIASTTINLTQKVTGTLPTANGGTGLSTLGTAGQALIVNSSATALSYATVGATAGQVIQVITGTDSTERNTTSTSFVTASNTLSVSITPSSASNKVFVIVNTGVFKATGGYGFLTIFRGATNLGGAGGMAQFQQAFYSSSCISFLDSPNTTSATTYQLYFRSSDSNPAYINANDGGGLVCSLTAFEIKG